MLAGHSRTMFATYFLLFLLNCRLSLSAGVPHNPLSDEFIELINKEGKWKAGRNFPADTPMEYLRNLAGLSIDTAEHEDLPIMVHDPDFKDSLPENFDSRNKWPNCPSIGEIRDQGRCGSCWAVSSVEVMTDRVCTYSNGAKNFHFSAEDIISCKPDVAWMSRDGCFGGSEYIAFYIWNSTGLVSGGNYNSHEGCLPYSVPTCPDHARSCTNYKPAPACVRECQDGYNTTYAKDKKRGKQFYMVKGEDDIKAEIYKNGPVTTSFAVYEDFAIYKGGIYKHLLGNLISGHAIKLLGWGVENGTKYWLAANSWGQDFGEGGFFKSLRGENECYIENRAFAGEPLMEDYN